MKQKRLHNKLYDEEFSNNFDATDMNFHERPKGMGKNLGPIIRSATDDMLLGYYPNLNKKERVICEIIISARWDIGDTYYRAIVGKTIEEYGELFHDKEEVELTIRQLCEKGVLKISLWWQKFGHTVMCDSNSCERILLRPVKYLDFTKDGVLAIGL